MALTPAEQAELQQLEAEQQQLDDAWRKEVMSDPEQRKAALKQVGIGDEGVGESALIGLGKGFSDIGTTAQQLTTFNPTEQKALQKQVDEERRMMGDIGSPIAAMVGQMGADIATTAVPGFGAVKGMQLLGNSYKSIDRLNKAAKALKPVKYLTSPSKSKLGALGKYGALGATGGAAGGFITPVGTDDTRFGQTLKGATIGALLSPVLGAGIHGAGVLTRKGVQRFNKFKGVQESKNSPVAKVFDDLFNDPSVPPEHLAHGQKVIGQFEKADMKELTPGLQDMIHNEVVNKNIGKITSSDAAQDVFIRKQQLANNKMHELRKQVDELTNTPMNRSNSEMNDQIADQVNAILEAAKKKATDASDEYYKSAFSKSISREELKGILNSAPAKEAEHFIKTNPGYQYKLEKLPADLVELESPRVMTARAVVSDENNIKKFNRLNNQKSQLTYKEVEFVNDYKAAQNVVDKATEQVAIGKLDYMVRRLREMAEDEQNKGMVKGTSKTVGSSYSEVANKLDEAIQQLVPELGTARKVYRENLTGYLELRNKGLHKLGGIKAKNIDSAIKNLINADPKDFAAIVETLNKHTPGSGDELVMRWIGKEIQRLAKSKDPSAKTVAKFFGSDKNIAKLKQIVKDPKAKKLVQQLHLLSKYNLKQGRTVIISDGLGGVPGGVKDASRRWVDSILDKLFGFVQKGRAEYLTDSSRWGKDLERLLSQKGSKVDRLKGIDEALALMISLSAGSELQD